MNINAYSCSFDAQHLLPPCLFTYPQNTPSALPSHPIQTMKLSSAAALAFVAGTATALPADVLEARQNEYLWCRCVRSSERTESTCGTPLAVQDAGTVTGVVAIT
ncbi:hypothetical protein ACJQWK_04418 [Exserohilum turcicum]